MRNERGQGSSWDFVLSSWRDGLSYTEMRRLRLEQGWERGRRMHHWMCYIWDVHFPPQRKGRSAGQRRHSSWSYNSETLTETTLKNHNACDISIGVNTKKGKSEDRALMQLTSPPTPPKIIVHLLRRRQQREDTAMPMRLGESEFSRQPKQKFFSKRRVRGCVKCTSLLWGKLFLFILMRRYLIYILFLSQIGLATSMNHILKIPVFQLYL